jgi:hypothetical protein
LKGAVNTQQKEEVMKKIIGVGVIVMLAMLGLAGPTSAASESRVAIISPQNGDDVSDTFALKYEMLDGLHDAKADVYLDEVKQNRFDGTFRGLTKGQHWITVTPSKNGTKADKDTITVEVK